jgi:phosphate transport system substrate-binding protein
VNQPLTEEKTVVNTARLLIIEVKNLGNTVIMRSDLTISRFRFEKGKVLLCGVQDQYIYPKDALNRINNGIKIDEAKECVEFIPEYFNKGDRANIKVMISEDITIQPEFDIQGGEAREIKPDQPQLTRRMILIGSGGLLGGLLVAGAIKPVSTFVQGQCALGSVIVGGSSAFLPTASRAITEYHNVCAVGPIDADIRGVTADSTQGINQLLDRQIQVACSELPRQDAEKIAAKRNQQIEANPLGLVVFALIINQNVGIQNLTVQNIQDIYAGRITDWSSVGGNNGNIGLLSRNPGSGTRRAFERFVFTGQYSGTVTSVLSTDEMYNAVVSTPGAIGYVDLKTAQERSSSGKAIILTIEGQEASTRNAAQKQYSFCAMEYLFTLHDPGSLVTSFIKQVKAKIAEDTLYYVSYDRLSPPLQGEYQ